MSVNTNSVIMAGNLTKDVELRFTQNGTAVAKFSMANNQRKKIGEEWEDEVSYFEVVVWSKQGEKCAECLHKGSSVLIEGKLKQNKWQNKEGENRYSVVIVAHRVNFLEKAPQDQNQASGSENNSSEGQSTSPGEIDEDSVPF